MRRLSVLVIILMAISITDASGDVKAVEVLKNIAENKTSEFNDCRISGDLNLSMLIIDGPVHYNGSAEGHGYPDLQVGEEVDPRPDFMSS
jgi:hypothetical protein